MALNFCSQSVLLGDTVSRPPATYLVGQDAFCVFMVYCVFVDLEKAYNRVPRGRVVVLYEKIRNGGKVCATCTGYVRGKQNSGEVCSKTYRKFQGQDRNAPGSALSLFLFAVIMDKLMNELRIESPWTLLFADNSMICQETREKVERRLKCWRYALERRGMKLSRSKTKQLCVKWRK